MLVTLREITAETVRQITRLAVNADQQRFVASNAVSLAEALFHEEAWFRAIYANATPAGFVMLYDESLRAAKPAEPKMARSTTQRSCWHSRCRPRRQISARS